MGDPEPSRRDRGLAFSAYEAKLVVAALCRYARASDVHDAHRDRCERLAGALAAGGSVTVASVGDGAETGDAGSDRVGDARRAPAPGSGRGRSDDAGREPVGGSGRNESTDDPGGESVRVDAGIERLDGTRVAAGAAREAGGEGAFRWGPHRADG